jgi:hypothetical protein
MCDIHIRLRAFCLAILLAGAFMDGPAVDAGAQGRGAGQPPAQPVQPLRFRFMGPAPSGRIASVAGISGDKMTYYAGAASGGIWKTTDGGQTFAPIFDDQPVQAIGALAVSRSDPKIIWAGTGEAWVIRPTDVIVTASTNRRTPARPEAHGA